MITKRTESLVNRRFINGKVDISEIVIEGSYKPISDRVVQGRWCPHQRTIVHCEVL